MFGGPERYKIIVCLEGKSMTPEVGENLFSSLPLSYSFDHHLGLLPLREGLQSYRDIGTPSDVAC